MLGRSAGRLFALKKGGRHGVPLGWINGVAAALFTATSMPLVWRAATGVEAAHERFGIGALISMSLAVFALNAILLGLTVNRWTYRILLPVFLLVHAGATYFAWAYGVVLDTSMMRNVMATDLREAGEFMVPGLWMTIALLGVLPSMVVLYLPIRRPPVSEAVGLRALWVMGLVCLLLASLVTSYDRLASLMRAHKHVRYLVAPANVFVSTVRALGENRARRGQRMRIAATARQAPHPAGGRPHVLVLVIGETVRAQNWGLSGYARQTTPQLARRGVINFADVTACGSSTEVSLPCMFSMQGRHEYDAQEIVRSESLLHLLARAGVQVLWRDNQTGCKGVCDGLPFESFRDATDPAYCTPADGCRDEVLLIGLKERLRATRADTVVVLHMLGNHGPAYFRRYPPELRRFQPDCRIADLARCTREEITNAYDNAVLATDRMLARTVDVLASTPQVDSALVYVSDHGESLGEAGLYLHGLPYPIAPDQQLKVPMVMWISPGMKASRSLDVACLQQRAMRPAEHDNLFHTVLGLLEVNAEPYQRSHDLSGACSRRGAGALMNRQPAEHKNMVVRSAVSAPELATGERPARKERDDA